MTTAKMKILLQLAVWIFLSEKVHSHGIGFGIKKEIFFLNLEDGYFGCQVNESTDFLQLYELSRLCDGKHDCYRGSDELRRELKCSNDCGHESGIECQNGACLDHQCHCNDGFGGCSCEVPDENECKNRPCDVFAHCTNTLGSFHCSCFPGYTGDGFHCQDINECDDPVLASRCVPNAECCNLPAHYLCRCLPGFQGDGEEECVDIDECQHPDACGINAVCHNIPGNYTCDCLQGYEGNPYNGCADIDECSYPGACAPGAVCKNSEGGYLCACPPGTTGDPVQGNCIDVDECLGAPCGPGAICANIPGSYVCSCPPGFAGDPYRQCEVVGCLDDSDCPEHQSCQNQNCQDPCVIANPCHGEEQCQVHDHQPACVKVCQCQKNTDCRQNFLCDGCHCVPSGQEPVVYEGCDHCPPGVPCNPLTGACIKGADASTSSHVDTTTLTTVNTPFFDNTTPIEIDKTDITETEVTTSDIFTTTVSSQKDDLIEVQNNIETSTTSSQKPVTDISDETDKNTEATREETTQNTLSTFVTSKDISTIEIFDRILESNTESTRNMITNNNKTSDDFEEFQTTTTLRGLSNQESITKTETPFFSEVSTNEKSEEESMPTVGGLSILKQGTTSSFDSDLLSTVSFTETDIGEQVTEHTSLDSFSTTSLEETVNPNEGGSTKVIKPDNSNSGATNARNQIEKTTRVQNGLEERFGIPSGDTIMTTTDNSATLTSTSIETETTSENESDKRFEIPATNYMLNTPTSSETTVTFQTNLGQFETTVISLQQSGETFETFTAELGTETVTDNKISSGIETTTNMNAEVHAGTTVDQNESEQRFETPSTESTTETVTDNESRSGIETTTGINAEIRADTTTEQLGSGERFETPSTESITETVTDNEIRSGIETTIGINAEILTDTTTEQNESGERFDTPSNESTTETVTDDKISSGIETTTNMNAEVRAETTADQNESGERFETPSTESTTETVTDKKITSSIETTTNMDTETTTDQNELEDRFEMPTTESVIKTDTDSEVTLDMITTTALGINTIPQVDMVNDQTNSIGFESVTTEIPTTTLGTSWTTETNDQTETIPSRTNEPTLIDERFGSIPSDSYTDSQPEIDSSTQKDASLTESTATENDQELAKLITNSETRESETDVSSDTIHPTTNSFVITDTGTVQNEVSTTSATEFSTNVPDITTETLPVSNFNLDLSSDKSSATESTTEASSSITPDSPDSDTESSTNKETSDELIQSTRSDEVTEKTTQDSTLQSTTIDDNEGITSTPSLGLERIELETSTMIFTTDSSKTTGSEILAGNTTPEIETEIGTIDANIANRIGFNNEETTIPLSTVEMTDKLVESTTVISDITVSSDESEMETTSGTTLREFENLITTDETTTGESISTFPDDNETNGMINTTIEESSTVTITNNNDSTEEPPTNDTHTTVSTTTVSSTLLKHRKFKVPTFIYTGKCTKDSDCPNGEACVSGLCAHCTHGINRLDCQKATGGRPKKPQPCEKDNECLDSEACYNGLCEDLCGLANICAPTAKCHVVKHRPVCTCPPGHQGNPALKCFLPQPLTCISNEDCGLTEACISHRCQHPCDVHNPCAQNAICINTNHGCDCACAEGFHGNGYIGCVPVMSQKSVCQYNEDCPPEKLCDRLNRVCINPCMEDSCGENAECIPANHGIQCRCPTGFSGNAYLHCSQVSGCRRDSECPRNEACINGVCGNPCNCGSNAICEVHNHKPHCKCLPGYGGNANVGCTGPIDPCDPNPCGVHALCEMDAGGPICYCPKGMTGNPFKNCIPEGDECTPNPCGSNSGCRIVLNSPVCFCLPEYEGNPPVEPCSLPVHPCNPSPCGPNTQCSVLDNGFAKCTCLPGYLESPNTIRGCVERRNPCSPNPCGPGALCDKDRNPSCYCPEPLVGNPYRSCTEPVKTMCQPGPCGHNADCYVVSHSEQCYCRPGFVGDPYTMCQSEAPSPCVPNPCGHHAICTITSQGNPMCLCPDGMGGDPTTGCSGPQCTIDDDCQLNQACIGYKCRDPCPGACGFGASCRVEKHHPVCTCEAGLIGNPIIRCYKVMGIEADQNPCLPSPCGANTECKIVNGRPVCSCLPHYIGQPHTGCRPECILNSDCPSDRACLNQVCVNPCHSANICGIGAVCTCRDHTPSCNCPYGTNGDPFIQCLQIPSDSLNTSVPCLPSPCGQGYLCSSMGEAAMCDRCGMPDSQWDPHCRPECLSDSECPFNKACLGQKCVDPCPGSCGISAQCSCMHHRPVCSCPQGMVGNPFEHCIEQPPGIDAQVHTCEDRCGSNAICKEVGGSIECECQRNFYGNPYLGCHPECITNSDCPYNSACSNFKCIDPCRGACGVNSQCTCINHVPICHCPPNQAGNPFVSCYPSTSAPPSVGHPENPCDPSPCGPNSRCIVSLHGYATCSCLPGFRGVPPACQPECLVSAECRPDRACINQKCLDPCPGTCGVNALCHVINHNPICSCPVGHVGDPFLTCQIPHAVENEEPKHPGHPCEPSPCGPNSICSVISGRPVCSCAANFIGTPPFCRPECTMNQECPHDKACIQEKCKDPCLHNCGQNAECHVVNHTPFCKCKPGYHGDAFIGCSKVPTTVLPQLPKDPCDLAPCGQNAQCTNHNGVARCSCIPPYIGDPYGSGCRPECLMNSDCPSNQACLSSHCRDPCPGVCGNNAQCSVVNHIPVCVCIQGYVGDPFQSCRPKPAEVLPPLNPCDPSPCGPNSICRVKGGTAACSCNENYIGAPPSCRPQCIASSECPPDRACINQKCADPCQGTCGLHATCHVLNHNPICSCPPDTVGDPFVRCVHESPKVPQTTIPENPCMPSPCGGNSECRVFDHRPVCSCLPGMLGAPPNCRPECLIHADCPTRLACIGSKCKDPCSGSCGFNTLCNVVNHQPRCTCQPGYEGDPFSGCTQAVPVEGPRDPCNPSPCGSNAVCKEKNGAGSCTCLPEYTGDPYTGCRPECVLNTDCPRHLACTNNKCRNPCPGMCGLNAECKVVNHAPTCNCLPGFTGNPLTACNQPPPPEPTTPKNPCIPSPCGPYSVCRVVDSHAVCSCQPNYIGSPPACRPECMISADCAQNKACINQKCVDPCPGTCGLNARCQVVNHNPICSCPSGFIGDPFVRCLKEEKRPVEVHPSGNPCVPSPCGPNSQCRPVGNTPACSCAPNYIGRPPNCRPECTINAECPGNLACQNEKCRDPCPGSCGPQATCHVVKHNPQCSCVPGYTGDPFSGCSLIVQQIPPTDSPKDPCNPSPCGANAVCKERNGAGSCSCIAEYFGDPYTGCRPECVVNSDCDRKKACMNNKCKDPCPGTCGINAECNVINHAPTCTCLPGFTGDPIAACRQPPKTPEPEKNPCQPSPCGPFSICRVANKHAVCSCQPNYIGTPPTCRPECMVSADCAQDKACLNQKCLDPCPGTCGLNARCQTVNHNPICSCPQGFTGDPFVRCLKEEKRPVEKPTGNPCIPSPCGPNSQCRVVGNTPACSCSPSYVGHPPNCRPECTINAECPGNLACQNEKCSDPCPGSCGPQATCQVVKHTPQCSCVPGYTGDPFAGCSLIQQQPTIEGPKNPCNPSPCGANAVCKERNGAGSCACLPEYFGDPYTGCRPECVVNSDCDRSKACMNNKCKDPCPGTCGLNAECNVINHGPSCTCLPGFIGDPMSACRQPQPTEPEKPKDPCQPSPCGPYSQCRVVNNHAVCSCQPNYLGTPPSCRPECMVSADCPQDKACMNQKCTDPCPGTCGINARCQVVNHNPICSCPRGFVGDPFSRCIKEEKRPVEVPTGNPCIPSPCGPNSQCKAIGNTPACSCSPNYVGRPPNCRPECTINAECPGNLACQNEKCSDPCPGSCGPQASCQVVKHNPQCSCLPGYTGDPFAGCSLVQQTLPTDQPRMPCNPSPCGANAVCKERNGAGSCSCLPEYFGDPYSGCRPECVTNSDCDRSKACMNNKCKDPCPGTCGINAECRVINHAPSCSCLQGYSGDPLTKCLIIQASTQGPTNPCVPSPCGPNSLCKEIKGHAVCTCQPNFVGSPPSCRPECVVSSDCSQDKACINQRCADPCPGTCGQNARCQVVNHNPICSCPSGFTGDPFLRCSRLQPSTTPSPPSDPCAPSPCGPYSQCRTVGSTPACSCLPNYIGNPPNCRPECIINAECAGNLACQNEKCIDPCPGSCGHQAECRVVNHNPVCTCPQGYIGDASTSCHPAPIATTERSPEKLDPCHPTPCGANAECHNRNGVGACSCLAGFQGDPYAGCRRECESNQDCAPPLACIGYKCSDPCPGTCGTGAECIVANHIPICTCPAGFTGDPFFSCHQAPSTPSPIPRDPCLPSPCGPNSQCRTVNQQAVCSCLPSYVGHPPTCRPECIVSSECPLDKACINQKCADPCPNTCGLHAQCNTKNHNPICACPQGYTGDPFSQCHLIPAAPPPPPTPEPVTCTPSPCGPNAQCQIVGGQLACSCLPNFLGAPPNCRPECVLSSECSSQLACINQKCRDPCPGSCGANTKCSIINHVPVCSCENGFTGDPFTLCSAIPITTPSPVVEDPCNPSPCGPNAVCRPGGICECIPEYNGNPYEACRPECVLSTECPRDKACQRNKCRNPCPGTCGTNAQCDVINHIPTCSCPQSFTGDPFTHCRPIPADSLKPKDLCNPSPCGPNSQCRAPNGVAVCSCLAGYVGSPPSCKPECILSNECSQTQACVNNKCTDPCAGSCGLNARCQVINHSPICSCPPGNTGDPFRSCYPLPIPAPSDEETPKNPCAPSPCGPNSQCQASGKEASCSCLPNYVGAPPNCRPECVINPDCSTNQACINNKCTDPCIGTCGLNAQCAVISHAVTCTCLQGYTGNAFIQCLEQKHEVVNPCEPSPCGPNAVCTQKNNAGSCACIADYTGNPYEGCRPECVLSSDCPTDKACIRNKCQDPCPGVCGSNAQCNVVNHVPTCSCIQGYVGDPFTTCSLLPPPAVTEAAPVDPCKPSPCGPNSQCRTVNGQAVCSCAPEFSGSPPNCRPECVVNSECPTNRACYKHKCTDPCPGTCGINARCQVINHSPICSCLTGQTGDPFTRCYPMPVTPEPVKPTNPCLPNPCGQNSHCQVAEGNQASCSCQANYIGSPPNCRPECLVNTDCPTTQACITEKCRDPCQGSCGLNAECRVQNHIPNCYCAQGFSGDPFTQCSQIIEKPKPVEESDPCTLCGVNTNCNNGVCICLPSYFGDPLKGCRPECTMNSDCSREKACVNQHCIDPCPGTCGQGAVCNVINHIPTCSCPPPTSGDPFVLCKNKPVETPRDPCSPSPCGPNSICRVSDGHAVCSCAPGQVGTPPQCRPECVVSAECPLTQACLNNKCRDPCPGICGLGARCNVVNHNPICSCPSGQTGDPFRQCFPIPATPKPVEPVNPCEPSPCGPNSQCHVRGDSPACSCMTNYIGVPPNCRPECTINPECGSNRACVNQKCIDPCPGSCGANAVCSVVNHTPICSCSQGHTGDPFTSCSPIPAEPTKPPTPLNPCDPSPCGSNAQCRIENRSYAVCECLPEYQGNPYEGCRPECVVSSDCPTNKACLKNKCLDPCPGTCGLSAVCTVSNHIPICSCPPGYTGDAFTRCEQIPQKEPKDDPCWYSPCGPNARCTNSNGIALCECLPGFSGTPTDGCKPECTISSDCPRNRACVSNKCIDPCPGVCGFQARCQVLNHSPICSCPPNYVGDPFSECREAPAPPKDPCNPSPCGVNGQCRVQNGIATCVYPECVINQDCPRDKACYAQKCQDPCIDACGINAICQAVNHKAVCSCPPDYTGEPRLSCQLFQPAPPPPECTTDHQCRNDKACINQMCKDPCQAATTSVCAYNAVCSVIMHRPICVCRDGLSGNAHTQCYDIGCRTDSECPVTESCVNKQCMDPCRLAKCGIGAYCEPEGGKGRCICPPGSLGNPFISCETPQCTQDVDCPSQLACRNLKCVDPCDCAPGAICTVAGHQPTCRCPPGYSGNPHQSCTIAPIVDTTKCKMDADCASKLACFSGECKNPCTETNPCGTNAECRVVDTLPLRTMSCHCLPGYIGDADVQCKLEESTKPQCSSDSQCSDTESCINRECVNPCLVSSPCGNNAECRPDNHKVTCHCPEGLAGNPYTNCYKPLDTSPECKSDSECASQLACINQRCQNPCVTSNPCSSTAECTTLQHRPTCTCPQGWAGDPQSHCYKPECRIDSDCLYDKACISGNCLSPCRESSCGRGAECRAVSHSAQCVCPLGTQGDPHVSCVTVVCQYNEDCADHEACDRLNRVCRPVCESDVCGTRATCIARSHQHKCICEPGTQGDPYVECTVDYRAHAECIQDSDCPSKTGCINRKCQDPCSLPAVCAFDQECRVQDTLPMRTVLCVCPPDTIASIDGHCRPIIKTTEECQTDSECRDLERCVRGSCVEACRIDPCGLNALCQSTRHQSVCTCPRGYIGNPHIECNPDHAVSVPSYQPVPECTHNDDCPANKRCKNQLCVNPCTHDSPCAPGAFCHTDDHQPVCRCPAGFQGNPLTQCIPPAESTVGCSSNSDCTPREACVNKLCISPCNCGTNAECKVTNHYPTCYCKPGYSGNPQIGCIKVGCESESQCSDDKTCYNSECINPCILGDPCGINAECYGAKHAAQCKCNVGYRGNPLVRCERIECSVDSDCSEDRLCRDHHCINPCQDQSNPTCAHNAICYVRNHQASCRCPDWMPLGDPLSYCQRVPPVSVPTVECEKDVECPSQLACINNKCLNPCVELSPCTPSSMCSVFDSTPVRTMVCTCPEGWVPDNDGECKPVIVPSPPGCVSDNECSSNETCINRMCRNPCNCGPNAECMIMNHRPICSCIPGYDGNPDVGCRAVGCRIDSECGSGKACINGNCINPCVVEDPCGPNAECYPVGTRPECRCLSGYRGNPYDRCLVVGCRSNSDCPNDRACINAQCINPCIYDQPCAARAKCFVQNHLPLCRCPPAYEGNPYTSCRLKVEPECRVDGDCPSFYACFNQQCKDPCQEMEPCQKPALCEAIKTLPVRTMICECPPGYISSGSGVCKATPPVVAIGECISDSDCPSDRACINAICKNPCNCGPNADCRVRDHKPVCSCLPGYDGNAEIECQKAGCRSNTDCPSQQACLNRECVPACSPDGSSCGTGAICYGSHHTALCECPPGLTGDPHVGCVHVECETNSDCPSDKACINSHCKSPCEDSDPCLPPGECTVFNHVVDCKCPPGFIGDTRKGCTPVEVKCKEDQDCPKQTACINQECVNPCNATQPCGTNSECKVFDTYPVRTMICECLPGYYGNAAVECVPVSECSADKGFVRNEDGECVCPPGTGLNLNDECERCPPEKGLKVDEKGRCVCDLEKGLIVDERGNCICRTDLGYHLDINGNCLPEPPVTAKTDFPQPEMIVSCLSDGVQVEIHIEEKGFNGVLYVKGHSKDEKCRRVLSVPNDSPVRTEIFKVNFGTCGLIHVNGQASFVLVIQKHPMLVTFKTQAYHIKCVYTTGEQNVTLGFNVSMLTTAGTIANTGPPPTCFMRIVTHSGQEINSAEIGDNLMLQVEVQPSTIYGGFARSCVAKTMEDTVENEYEVTDENGCATDPSIFGEWDYNPETQSLMANFNAFKFPSSDNIRFQCNIRVCFGKCQPVNCRGYNAFGRRRREIRDTNRTGADIYEPVSEGQLREEITIQSNAILTFERREERFIDPREGRLSPEVQQIDDICVSMIGFIIALVITALLALVAVAVAVSCWLIAYRRRPKVDGPLPHPPDFPNPLFTTPDPLAEPSPDYLS